jgi:hypothetical protein
MNYEDNGMGAEEMDLSAAATTIDPSVIQSRILQSTSLQKENAAMEEDGDQQQPVFPKLSAAQASGNKIEYRRVRCPAHRYTPLRENWEQILTPLVEYLKLQVRTQWTKQAMGFGMLQRKKRPIKRNVHCVVPWNETNPPGSLNANKERNGAAAGRSLMPILYKKCIFCFFSVVLT